MDLMIAAAVAVDSVVAEVDAVETFNHLDVVVVDSMMTAGVVVDGAVIEVLTVVGVAVEAAAVVVVAEAEIVIIVIVAMIVEVEEIAAKVVVPDEHHQEDRHLLIRRNLDGIQVQNRIKHHDGETHHQRKNQLVKDGVMPHQIKMTHQNRKQEVDGEQVQNKMKEQVVGVKKNQNLMIKQNPMYRYLNQLEKTQLLNRPQSQCRSSLQSLIKSLMMSLNQPQFRLQFHLQHKTTKTLP